MKTSWQCQVCGKSGLVRHWLFRDLMYIFERISRDHRKLSLEKCTNPVEKLEISAGDVK